jgi:hypothetical protein
MKKVFLTYGLLCIALINVLAQVPAQQPYPPAPPALSNINAVEYFAGNSDPGVGAATPLSITAGTNVTESNVTINFPALADGVQFLYLRTKDASGKWSLTNYKLFTAGNVGYPTPETATNITQAEVYVANASSPDFGSATPVNIPTPGTDVTLTNTNINFSALADGVQFLYLRTKDASGKWSLTNYKLFTVGGFGYAPAPAALPNIVKAEVFAGTDPGVGNATNLPIPNGTDVSTGTVTVPVPALPNGNQDLYVRSLDANGKWSLTNYKQFTVGIFGYPLAPSAAPAVGNLEYYVDTDPGFGNGTAITVPSNSTDVQLSNISIPVSGTLANGNHVFHIRSKQNPWSIDNARSFSVGGVVPVTWLFVKAQVQANDALINWATAQEIDSKKFEIEWSTNGINFSNIGEVAAAGNASTTTNYNFTHKNIGNGFNYYRIKQIDNNGDYKYSTIVKVLFNKNLKQTIIAPNPVADVLQIVQPNAVFVKAISIIDSKGSIVLQKIINSKEQVISMPVSKLASGMYTLKMQYENEVLSYPFIKN